MRFIRCLSLLAVLAAATLASAQPKSWVTIKGQVKLTKLPDDVKENEIIQVTTDKNHCLAKGALKKQNIIRSKDGGFANVIVWIRPDNETRGSELTEADIHPDLKKVEPKKHVIDQPCCQFEPRITVARVGDSLEVKNSAPVNHNFAFSGDNNGNVNPNIPPGESYKFAAPLKAERFTKFACSVHPWMGGGLQVFDHPYFALTDKDGKFEIKNAPVGKYRIMYYHEESGFHKGVAGRFGTQITIEGNGGTMEMKPMEFEFVKRAN